MERTTYSDSDQSDLDDEEQTLRLIEEEEKTIYKDFTTTEVVKNDGRQQKKKYQKDLKRKWDAEKNSCEMIVADTLKRIEQKKKALDLEKALQKRRQVTQERGRITHFFKKRKVPPINKSKKRFVFSSIH